MLTAPITSTLDEMTRSVSPPRNFSQATPADVEAGFCTTESWPFSRLDNRNRKIISALSKTSPSNIDRFPSIMRAPANSVAPSICGSSLRVVPASTVIALMIRVTPNTSPVFAMFDPNALPTANSPDPDKEAMTDMTISGADVPSETMVKPINNGERPARLAIAAAPSTNLSELQTSPINPATIKNTSNIWVMVHLDRLNSPLDPSDRLSYAN